MIFIAIIQLYYYLTLSSMFLILLKNLLYKYVIS